MVQIRVFRREPQTFSLGRTPWKIVDTDDSTYGSSDGTVQQGDECQGADLDPRDR
jgi:hypothetical protein